MQRPRMEALKTREAVMHALFALLLLAAGPALAAEKYVGGNVDVRTVLAFKAPDASVLKFLPAVGSRMWPPDEKTREPVGPEHKGRRSHQ